MTRVMPTRENGVIRVIGKERALKSGPRIKLLSAIDEVASALGRAQTFNSNARVCELLLCVQCDLYLLMADVATPPHCGETVGMTITPAMVQWLEAMTAALRQESDLPNACIPPCDGLEDAALAVARTVIRRAERLAVWLVQQHLMINPDILRYLNHLSDLIFTLTWAALARQGRSRAPPQAERRAQSRVLS